MRRIVLLVTVAAAVAAFGVAPALAQSGGSGLYPVGGEDAPPAVPQSTWDQIVSIFEDSAEQTAEEVGTSALENGPEAIDPYSEFQDMQQNVPLAEYEDLLENANQTGETVNDDFFPSFEELFQRVNDAFSPDDGDEDGGDDGSDDDGNDGTGGPPVAS